MIEAERKRNQEGLFTPGEENSIWAVESRMGRPVGGRRAARREKTTR